MICYLVISPESTCRNGSGMDEFLRGMPEAENRCVGILLRDVLEKNNDCRVSRSA